MRFKSAQAWKSLALLILLGMIWGTGYSIARFAMTQGVPPLGYSFWQSLGPAVILFLITLTQSSKCQINQSLGKFYLMTGLTGIALPNSVMYFAAAHLPASILAIIVNTVPIFAYPLALIARLEIFNWQRFIGVVFAVVSLALIILPKSSLPSAEMLPWVVMTLLTPLSFAFCSIYIARSKVEKSNIACLTSGMLIASTLLLFPLVLKTHAFYTFNWPFSSADQIILLEIILSSVGYLLFFYLIRTAGPVFYSLVDSVVVVTGVFWAILLFQEQLSYTVMIAIFFAIFGLLLVTNAFKTQH